MKRIIISLAVVFFSQAVCAAEPSDKPVNGFVADQRCQEKRNIALARCLGTTMPPLLEASQKAGAGLLCLAGAYAQFMDCVKRNNNPVVTK